MGAESSLFRPGPAGLHCAAAGRPASFASSRLACIKVIEVKPTREHITGIMKVAHQYW